MSRVTAGLVSVLAGTTLAVLAGCSALPTAPGACPASGHIEGVEITVVPATSSAPDLQACAGSLCSPVTRAGQRTDGWTGDAPIHLRLDGTSGTSWFLALDMRPLPTRITLRLRRGGHLEQTTSIVTHWRRAHPADRCDLHEVTPAVTVRER